MTRSEMITFIKANPFIPITHLLFDDSEYIYADEQGNVWDENGNLFEDWYTPYMHDGIRLRDKDWWLSEWEIRMGVKLCKYRLNVPAVPSIPIYKENQTLCGAYSASKPTKENRWRHWAHYPKCAEENCPLKHPSLLEGRTLAEEE